MVEDAERELEAEGRKRARSCQEQTKVREEPYDTYMLHAKKRPWFSCEKQGETIIGKGKPHK